jgi:hypothetical protein
MRGISWLAERTLSFLRRTLLHGVIYVGLTYTIRQKKSNEILKCIRKLRERTPFKTKCFRCVVSEMKQADIFHIMFFVRTLIYPYYLSLPLCTIPLHCALEFRQLSSRSSIPRQCCGLWSQLSWQYWPHAAGSATGRPHRGHGWPQPKGNRGPNHSSSSTTRDTLWSVPQCSASRYEKIS